MRFFRVWMIPLVAALAIAAGVVRRHGGRIRAANGPDGGLQVRIELPVAPAA